MLLEPADRSPNLPAETAAQAADGVGEGLRRAPRPRSATSVDGRDDDRPHRDRAALGREPGLLPHVRRADARARARRAATCARGSPRTARRRVSDDERALRRDHGAPRRDHEARARHGLRGVRAHARSPSTTRRMMAAHGYSLDDIAAIQTAAGVGNTPLLELRNLTDLVRSYAEPGHGARIFVKDEAANMAGSFKDRRASDEHPRGAGEGLRGRHRRDVGQLRRGGREPGGARRPRRASSCRRRSTPGTSASPRSSRSRASARRSAPRSCSSRWARSCSATCSSCSTRPATSRRRSTRASASRASRRSAPRSRAR